ncbi:hypothetical protein NOF04DRAFT_1017869 [Fusarium oxysporum II5]|nr:hypothetical protein NOF04DRAFT_1017869 [Fusarium oxysporum II5]
MKPSRETTWCRPVSAAAIIGPVGSRRRNGGVASSFMLTVMASIRSAAMRCWWKHHSLVCNFELFAGWRFRVALLTIVLFICGKLFALLNQEPAGLRSGVQVASSHCNCRDHDRSRRCASRAALRKSAGLWGATRAANTRGLQSRNAAGALDLA